MHQESRGAGHGNRRGGALVASPAWSPELCSLPPPTLSANNVKQTLSRGYKTHTAVRFIILIKCTLHAQFLGSRKPPSSFPSVGVTWAAPKELTTGPQQIFQCLAWQSQQPADQESRPPALGQTELGPGVQGQPRTAQQEPSSSEIIHDPALRRLRQEAHCQFEVSLGSTARCTTVMRILTF